MLRCNIACAHYIAASKETLVSKQLSISATLSVLAMAAFAVLTSHGAQPVSATVATAHAAAPALEAALPGS
jgi:hypothetical protein